MKKIALSLATIGAVGVVSTLALTGAWFTDTETSADNLFSTGTIDIAVDGENPWARTEPYLLEDVKPSQVEYIEFTVHNVGSNPANIFKTLTNFSQDDGQISEPECTEAGGTWEGYIGTDGQGVCTGSYAPNNDLDSAVRYDMSVWVYNVDPATNPQAEPIWWQVIYTDDMDVRLSDIADTNMMLGMVPVDWYMVVRQSYHVDSETGNWAQGDVMHFDINLLAEQLKGTVLMQNKHFASGEEPTIVWDDAAQGVMTYTVKDATFDFDFSGVAPIPGVPYSLVFYHEPWSTPSASGWPRNLTVLGSNTADASGNVAITGSHDFGYDILNMKVWLVKSSDINGSDQLSVWSGNDNLYELGMLDYYDSL